MTVLYFEDIEIGRSVTVGDYEVTRDEVVTFARQWDPQPFHLDEQAAADSIHGGLIAAGSHIMAIRTALLCRQRNPPAVLAALGWDEVRFPNPARVGDRLSLETRFVSKRESTSRPDRGIVRSEITVSNQDGLPVLTQQDTIMVARVARQEE